MIYIDQGYARTKLSATYRVILTFITGIYIKYLISNIKVIPLYILKLYAKCTKIYETTRAYTILRNTNS